MINLILVVLLVGSVFRIATYIHEQRQVAALRKDIRFVYLMMRILALEGEWPARCKQKFLEVMVAEDLPIDDHEDVS